MRIHHHQKKFRAIASAGKVMESVFWDTNVALFMWIFLPLGATINSEYYCRVLSDVHTRLWKKNGLV